MVRRGRKRKGWSAIIAKETGLKVEGIERGF